MHETKQKTLENIHKGCHAKEEKKKRDKWSFGW